LNENFSISELVNNFLAKNKKKIVNILNENNYSNDDCVLIIRSFLNKSKKILKLSEEYEKNNNINITISNARPPIFWKEKEITVQQIQKWKPKKIKQLIYKLNELELNIKKILIIQFV
jgi:DNA polymerase-3 subunit delta